MFVGIAESIAISALEKDAVAKLWIDPVEVCWVDRQSVLVLFAGGRNYTDG